MDILESIVNWAMNKKKKPKMVKDTNMLVPISETESIPVTALIKAAGHYQELEKRYENLRVDRDKLLEENVLLRNIKKTEEVKNKKINLKLTKNEKMILDLITDKSITKVKIFDLVLKNKKIKIKSKSSAYRLLGNLEKKGYIKENAGEYVKR